MAFPSSPSNGQQALVNGITYVYNSTKTAWLRASTTGANLTASSLTITANTNSVSSTSGAMIVGGGMGIGGNLYVAGAIYGTIQGTISTTSLSVSGNITSSSYINGAYLTGTLQTASQPYITTLGNITTGNITTGNITAAYTQLTSLGVGTGTFGNVGEIRATNAITSYYSDERLKTKLGVIENALDKVDQLTGFYYEANDLAQGLGYTRQREVGVSAQATQAVLPEIVKTAPISDEYLTVQYERFAPLLIEAIKELRQEVNELKRRLGN